MTFPKISIVIPVYNGERFIGKAILSILNQTFKDIEVIIVDDGSFDGTVSVINSIKDVRIRLIQNNINMGNAKARNIGNEAARGKYIAVLDADDVALPERLQIQYNYLEQNTKVG